MNGDDEAGAGPEPEAITRRPDEGRVVFDTTDPEHSMAYLTAAYGTAIKLIGHGDQYRFRHARLGSGPIYIDTIYDTLTSEYSVDPNPALIVVGMQRGVRANLDHDHRYGPGDVVVCSQPGESHHVRQTGALYTAVQIPLRAAADAALNRPDDDLGPLRFTSLRPASPAAVRHWRHAVDYVMHNLRAHSDAMAQPLLSGPAARLLAATLLVTFPNTWVAESHHQDTVDATPTTLSRAVAFIEANAHLDIGVLDIARASYVTVRAVQLAFRRELNTTPTTYLRRVRLERAHEQLVAASPDDGTTVTEVGVRWGYPDPSQFAAHYRQTYGHLPSQTLRS
jgi:AraC-like DNA-binding protein